MLLDILTGLLTVLIIASIIAGTIYEIVMIIKERDIFEDD